MHSRDVHLRLAREHRSDPAALAEHATAALREQQILETFFGRTLAASRDRLEQHRRRWLVRHANRDAYYISKVSRHLVTWTSQRTAVAALLVVVAGLAVLLRRLSRSERPPQGPGRPRQRDRSPSGAEPGIRR